jgi:hypothetical protein
VYDSRTERPRASISNLLKATQLLRSKTWRWWHTPLIPELGRGGRGRRISEFEASLVYKLSSRTARAIQRNTVSNPLPPKKKQDLEECGVLNPAFLERDGLPWLGWRWGCGRKMGSQDGS